MKICAYLRVSTDKQDAATQLDAVQGYCASRSWSLARVYRDDGLSGRAAARPPAFGRLMKDSTAGKVPVVVIYSLSRFTRRGSLDTLQLLHRLNENHTQVVSVSEPWLDMTSPFADVLISMIGWVNKQFTEDLSAATRAGLERARRQGRVGGRPKVERPPLQELGFLREAQGKSWDQCVAAFEGRYSKTTLHRIYRTAKTEWQRRCLEGGETRPFAELVASGELE